MLLGALMLSIPLLLLFERLCVYDADQGYNMVPAYPREAIRLSQLLGLPLAAGSAIVQIILIASYPHSFYPQAAVVYGTVRDSDQLYDELQSNGGLSGECK